MHLRIGILSMAERSNTYHEVFSNGLTKESLDPITELAMKDSTSGYEELTSIGLRTRTIDYASFYKTIVRDGGYIGALCI